MTELEKANQRIAELEAQEVELCTLYGIAQAENGKLWADLEAICAGGVYGPLMRTPTSGAADLPEALTADQWLDLAIRHAHKDWNSAQPDGYANAVKALCADFAALTAQDPSQLGGFSAGDMASAAAQGYRQGYEQRDAEVRGALV